MNKVSRQRKRISLFLVSMVCVFGLNYSSFAQAMMIQNNNFVSEISIGSITPSIPLGSVDSLYNSLMLKLRNKNAHHVGAVCRRFLRLDDLCEGEEGFAHGVAKRSLFSFVVLQKWLLASLLFSTSTSSIASDNQQRRSVTCFNLPAYIETHACPLANRCPSDYSLCVGLSTNACAASIAHYSSSAPIAFVTACVVSGFCGYLEGVLPDQNHQGYVRSYSTSYPADQVCIPAGACWQGDSMANAAAIGASGYYIGRGAGVCTRKYCCSNNIPVTIVDSSLSTMPVTRAQSPMERGYIELKSSEVAQLPTFSNNSNNKKNPVTRPRSKSN